LFLNVTQVHKRLRKRDKALDDDLGSSRNHQVVGLALDHLDGRIQHLTGNVVVVHEVGDAAAALPGTNRRHAEGDGEGHVSLPFFLPHLEDLAVVLGLHPIALHRVLVMDGGAVDRPVCPLAIGGLDGIHTAGLQHALGIAHVLERHGELIQVDLVTDPNVLLTRCILVLDNDRRVHRVVFYRMLVGFQDFHQRGRREIPGCP